MIGLSVAIGRFVEALFWAILRVAGTVATAVIAAAIALVALALLARHLLKSSPERGGGAREAGDGGVSELDAKPASPSTTASGGGPPPRSGEE